MNNFLPEKEGKYLDEYVEPVKYFNKEEKILPQQLVFSFYQGAMAAPSANRQSDRNPAPPALLGAMDAVNTFTFERIALSLSVLV